MWFSASLALAAWPEDPTLKVLPSTPPACWVRPTIMISAGHGAPKNHGNVGIWGQQEEDVTLELAADLGQRLAPHVTVIQSRTGSERPSYDARIERLHASGATLLIELHTDWRLGGEIWADSPHGEAWWNATAPGFSVLYRHAGAQAEGRRDLARALATSLAATGLPPYDGRDYGGLYDTDSTAGVYLDKRGLRMLWRPRVPAVIIEVHNASDPTETLLWRTEPVREAFASAVLDALLTLTPCTPAPQR